MDLETVFSITNAIALGGWLALLLSPFAPKFVDKLSGIIIPLILAIAYLMLAPVFFTATEGGFDSLEAVMLLFGNEKAVMAGWLHYLAFDLFIGAWQVRQAREHRIHHLMIIPSLVLTLLFGPVGLIVFLVIRYYRTKQFWHG